MEADIVHLLDDYGRPFCGFANDVANWPSWHAWVFDGDPRATCRKCREVAAARAALAVSSPSSRPRPDVCAEPQQ